MAQNLTKAYSMLIEGRNMILQNFSNVFTERLMNPKIFTKELFLEPSECYNSSFMLPHLTRDSHSSKGMFYRTEKVVTHKHNPIFCDLIPKAVKDKLSQAYAIVEPKITQEKVFVALNSL